MLKIIITIMACQCISAHHLNGDGQVEHKKKERIKQLAADRRTAQKFFLIQEMLVLKMTLMMVDYDEMMVTDDDDLYIMGAVCVSVCYVFSYFFSSHLPPPLLGKLFWQVNFFF